MVETAEKNRGNAGKGRRKGSKNKRPRVVQEMVLHALDYAGGVEYLTKVAEENPPAFLALLGKLIPRTVTREAVKLPPIKRVIIDTTGAEREGMAAKVLSHSLSHEKFDL